MDQDRDSEFSKAYQRGLAWYLTKRIALLTFAMAACTVFVWFLEGQPDPWTWINGAEVPHIKNWLWFVVPYFLGLAVEVWLARISYRFTSRHSS